MKYSDSAVQLNDSGVRSLLHHKYEEATAFFRRALTMMKEQRAYCSKRRPSAVEQQEEMLYESITVEFYQLSQTGDEVESKSGFQHPVVCQMALSILPVGAASSAVRRRKSLVCAVIFNLAITTHLRGLQSGSMEHLRAALRLYEIVYRTLRGYDVLTGSTTISVVTTTLNNVACIHVIMGHQEFAATFHQELLTIMMYCRTGSGEPTKRYGQSWRVCWGNILTFLLGPPSTAGAA